MTPSSDKQYYFQRKNETNLSVSLELLRQIFSDYYNELDRKGYLDEWLGDHDEWGVRSGGKTSSPESYVLRKLRKNLWPLEQKIHEYSEDELLTVIEFIHDHVSKPGVKFGDGFDMVAAQKEFREELNPILRDFGSGLTIDTAGEIRLTEPAGMEMLLTANIPQPSTVSKDLIMTLEKSIDKFKMRSSTIDDRKAIVLELASLFEELQKQDALSQVLNNKDESAIFEFANKFALRHRDPDQIKNYDKDIWLSWAFYYYLATIHAVLRLIQRQEAISEKSEDLWIQVLEELRRQNTTAYGIMRMAIPTFSKGLLSLGFAFPFHAKRAQSEPLATMLEKVTKSIYGNNLKLRVFVTKRQAE